MIDTYSARRFGRRFTGIDAQAFVSACSSAIFRLARRARRRAPRRRLSRRHRSMSAGVLRLGDLIPRAHAGRRRAPGRSSSRSSTAVRLNKIHKSGNSVLADRLDNRPDCGSGGNIGDGSGVGRRPPRQVPSLGCLRARGSDSPSGPRVDPRLCVVRQCASWSTGWGRVQCVLFLRHSRL